MKVRKILNRVHLYSGLVTAIALIVISLTGSVIAFDQELDRLINPNLLTVDQEKGSVSIAKVIENAKSIYPERALAYIYPPSFPGDVYVVRFKSRKPNSEGKSCCSGFNWSEVIVNPYNGNITGYRERNDYEFSKLGFMRFMHGLHDNLLLEDFGKNVVGISAIIWLLTSLIGVYLWWPGLKKIRMALSIKRNVGSARFVFDIHRSFGMYSLIVMVVIAFSGAYFIYPGYVRPMLSVFLDMEKVIRPKSKANEGVAISPDSAVNIAKVHFPNSELRTIGLPENSQDSYSITFRQDGEVNRNRGGKTTVWIDQYSGSTLLVRDGKNLASGEVFLAWQMPLHGGSAFGMPGKLIILISGLVSTIMIVTGIMIWLRKRNKIARTENKVVAINRVVGSC